MDIEVGTHATGIIARVMCTDDSPGYQIRGDLRYKYIEKEGKFMSTMFVHESDIFRSNCKKRSMDNVEKKEVESEFFKTFMDSVVNPSAVHIEFSKEEGKYYKLTDFKGTMGINKMLVPINC